MSMVVLVLIPTMEAISMPPLSIIRSRCAERAIRSSKRSHKVLKNCLRWDMSILGHILDFGLELHGLTQRSTSIVDRTTF